MSVTTEPEPSSPSIGPSKSMKSMNSLPSIKPSNSFSANMTYGGLGQLRIDFLDCLARIEKEHGRILSENSSLTAELEVLRYSAAAVSVVEVIEAGGCDEASSPRSPMSPLPRPSPPASALNPRGSSPESGGPQSSPSRRSFQSNPSQRSRVSKRSVEEQLDIGGVEDPDIVKPLARRCSVVPVPKAMENLQYSSTSSSREATTPLKRAGSRQFASTFGASTKLPKIIPEPESELGEDEGPQRQRSPGDESVGKRDRSKVTSDTPPPPKTLAPGPPELPVSSGSMPMGATRSRASTASRVSNWAMEGMRSATGPRATIVNIRQWAHQKSIYSTSSLYWQSVTCGSFHPQGKFMSVWRPCLFTAILWAVLTTPFELGYGWWVPPSGYKTAGLIFDFLFMIDIIISFNLAYAAGDLLVTDRKQIARNYITTSLIPDLVSSFPYDWFAGSGGKGRKFVKVFKLPKILRFLKLINLVKYQTQYLGTLSSFCALLLLSHYFACAWGWVLLDDCDTGCPQVEQTYLEALAVSVAGLTGMDSWKRLVDSSGHSRLTSTRNHGEPLHWIADFITFLMVVSGWILLSCLFGSVAFAISGRNKIARDRALMRERRLTEMKAANIPEELQEKAQATYEYIWRTGGADHNEMLNDPNLSLDLRRDLALWIYGASLRKVPGLRNVPDMRLKCLAQHCEQRLYSPGDLLVMYGDVGEELFVLQSGSVRPLQANGDPIEDVVLHTGAFFGEMCFLRPGSRRSASMQALEFCRCLVVTLKSFAEYDLQNAVESIRDQQKGAAAEPPGKKKA